MNRRRISILFTTFIVLVISMAMMAGCGLDLKFRKKVEKRGWSYMEQSRLYGEKTEDPSTLDEALMSALRALDGNMDEPNEYEEGVTYGKYVDKSTYKAIKKMRLMAILEKTSNDTSYQVLRFEFDDAIAALKYYNVAKKSLKEKTALKQYLIEQELKSINESIAKAKTPEKEKQLREEYFKVSREHEDLKTKSKQMGAKLSGKVVTIGSNESIEELMRDSK